MTCPCGCDMEERFVDRRATLLGFLFLLCGLVSAPFASEPLVIGWDDLAPQPVEVDNPFSRLEPDQLDGLRKLLRYQMSQNRGSDLITAAEAETLRAKLEADGLDVDWLFEQRRIIMETRHRVATETNADLIGKRVRMPGYLLPLTLEERKAVEFLLVPTLGACIHTPPPPANQVVHVRYPEGFEIQGLFTPIWISGELQSENSVEKVRYADGETDVQRSYAMTATLVEPY